MNKRADYFRIGLTKGISRQGGNLKQTLFNQRGEAKEPKSVWKKVIADGGEGGLQSEEEEQRAQKIRLS